MQACEVRSLSCFVLNGDLERADDQLIQSIKLFPEYLAGASQLRHLVKAAQARKDFSEGAATAQFVEGVRTSEQAISGIFGRCESIASSCKSGASP